MPSAVPEPSTITGRYRGMTWMVWSYAGLGSLQLINGLMPDVSAFHLSLGLMWLGLAVLHRVTNVTDVSPYGVRFPGRWLRRVISWDEVADVEMPGRYDTSISVHLTSGETVKLPFVPVGRAGALKAYAADRREAVLDAG